MANGNLFEPAIDAAEQLRRWDAGETIWTIEMGGMGPGYEQAIQVLAIEIVRDNLGKPLPGPDSPAGDWGQSTCARIDVAGADLGFSGAQFSAARFLAYKWLTIGPAALQAVKQMEDRHIQASQSWPRVLPGTANGTGGSSESTPEVKTK